MTNTMTDKQWNEWDEGQAEQYKEDHINKSTSTSQFNI